MEFLKLQAIFLDKLPNEIQTLDDIDEVHKEMKDGI